MRQSFIVNISHTKNATWQGTITWMDENRTESFRSALELLFLIDSAVSTGEAESGLKQFSPPIEEGTRSDTESE